MPQAIYLAGELGELWGELKVRGTMFTTGKIKGPGRAVAHVFQLEKRWWLSPLLLGAILALLQGVVVNFFLTSGESLKHQYLFADGGYYTRIAASGYPSHLIIGKGYVAEGAEYAFSPLYPIVTGLVSHLFFLPIAVAALLVNFIASLLLGLVVYRIARRLGASHRWGLYSVLALHALPLSIVYNMAYGESLFALFTALMVRDLLEGYPQRAKVMAVLAGLARPQGYIPAVFLAVWTFRHSEGRMTARLLRSGGNFLVGMSGTVFWWCAVGAVTHKPLAWFDIQREAWDTSLDGGQKFYEFLSAVAHAPTTVFIEGWGVIAIIACFLVLLVWASVRTYRHRELLPFYSAGLAAMASTFLSSNYWSSKPRLLLAAFLMGFCLLPFRTTRRKEWVVAPLLVVLFGLSLLVNGYAVTRWHSAI